MRMSKEEASKYKGYALTPEQLIKKAQNFADGLTSEERAEEQSIKGFHQVKDKYGTSFEYGEIKRISVGEFYDGCINDMKERYEEYKKMDRTYKPFAVSPKETKFDKTKLTESEKMSDFMYYLFDKGFSLKNADNRYPYEILELCFWSFAKSRQSPEIRKSEEAAEMKIEEDKKYIMPGEKDVPYTTIVQRRAKANPPKTSLSDDQIASFDRMSDKWLTKWCNFSSNWLWVVPVLCLCPFVNKGFASAVGLLLFMGGGTYYSEKVQEYCSIILPWYKEAGIMLERRVFNKL